MPGVNSAADDLGWSQHKDCNLRRATELVALRGKMEDKKSKSTVLRLDIR